MIDLPLLIEEVHKRPALWDQANPHRHNREALELLWEDVAKVFGAPPDDIRKKWKGLRDTFRKELRKYPHGFDQDLSQEEVPWVFFKPLYFLKGQMRPRKADAALAGNGYHYLMGVTKEDEDDSAEDMLDRVAVEPSVCDTLRDLGARGVKRPLDESEDEDYHFFMSLLPHVRKLEPLQKLQLRAKMQDMVCLEVYGGPGGPGGPGQAQQAAGNGVAGHHEAPEHLHHHQLM